MKRAALILITLLAPLYANSGMDQFILKVRENSPEIRAVMSLEESEIAYSGTGINPPGPDLNFGYFPGKPSDAGNKITWSVIQSFDFPSTYSRIRDIRNTDRKLASLEAQKAVNQILCESRNMAIEYIFLQKQLDIFTGRLESLEEMREAYLKMVETGESTIIELNKIEIQVINSRSQLLGLEGNISRAESRLDYLSGGNAILLKGSAYPLLKDPSGINIIEEKEKVQPAFLIPGYRIEKAQKSILLQKAGNLPGLNIGIASESVASQTFTGPVAGISIPLWEQKGKVAAARASLSYEESAAYAELESLRINILSNLEMAEAVKKNMDMILQNENGQKAKALLNRSLSAGEIRLTDYLVELREYYGIEDRYLELEKEYYLLLSNIWDHTL
ncbi:MAG: TolC family protein [Bacteroidales bacterium]